MDEPLGALDKNLREEMQYEIKHLHEALGITMVYVTHDQSEALTMSNRIAVFDDGVIQQLAKPSVLYEKPINAFVAEFIGENNRLLGTVTAIDGNVCTVRVESGEIVKALRINVGKMGDRTTLSLRPERVVLGPGAEDCPNTFDAKVLELIYLGDHIRTRICVCQDEGFIVKVPNSSGDLQLIPGSMVKVGWHCDDCRALDA
jgi:putative spermidine/putrescine transport system ATP-binding protein